MGEKPQQDECLVSPKTRTRSGHNDDFKKGAKRTIFTPQQLFYLEEKFVEDQFPDAEQRERIASHVNLTSHHVQVWFQNKRAKARRKLKKLEIEKTKVHVPKPPSFWPQHLPFDSNFTEVITKLDVDDSATTNCKTLPSCSKITNPNNSTVELNTLNSPASSSAAAVFSHQKSTSYLQSSSPMINTRTLSDTHMELLPQFSRGPSVGRNSTEFPVPSTLPQYQQMLYNPGGLKSCHVDQNYADNTSLLLLANCATLTTVASQVDMQGVPVVSLTEESRSRSSTSVLVQVNTSDTIKTHVPPFYHPHTAQTCDISPHVGNVTSPMCSFQECVNDCNQYNQSPVANLQPFRRSIPSKMPPSIPGMESQHSSLSYPIDGIQTPVYSEEPFPYHEILNNQ